MPQLDIYILSSLVYNSIFLYLLLLFYNLFYVIIIINILLKINKLIYFLVKKIIYLLLLQKNYLKNNFFVILIISILTKNLEYIKNEILFNEIIFDKYNNITNILKYNIQKINKKKNIKIINYVQYL